MDLDIWTDRPEKRATCRACAWDSWLTDDGPPPHTCRSAPAVPRTTLQDHARAAHAVFAKRELEIRAERMAEIDLAQVRRGRI